MTALEEKLKAVQRRNRVGLMTHLVIGYPTLKDTASLAKVMAENGADILELQIPFSDPIADGPTIMKACEISLLRGTKVDDAFSVMAEVTKAVSIPVLFMAYFNTVFTYGVTRFCRDAAKSGAVGLIVPDMPIDEEASEHFMKACRKYKLHHIHVISPNSTTERIKMNAKVANGFLYCTTRHGVTGARDFLDPSVKAYLEKVKKSVKVPLAVGFGITSKEQIVSLQGFADVAVVGSAIINKINREKKGAMKKVVGELVRELAS